MYISSGDMSLINRRSYVILESSYLRRTKSDISLRRLCRFKATYLRAEIRGLKTT